MVLQLAGRDFSTNLDSRLRTPHTPVNVTPHDAILHVPFTFTPTGPTVTDDSAPQAHGRRLKQTIISEKAGKSITL